MERFSPPLLSVLRIAASLLFLEEVAASVLHWPSSSAQLTAAPAAFSAGWIVGVVELLVGVGMAVGLFTRPLAMLLAVQMAAGYYFVHAARAPLPLENGGVAALLYFFVFLYLAAAGPGAWSVDTLLRQRT